MEFEEIFLYTVGGLLIIAAIYEGLKSVYRRWKYVRKWEKRAKEFDRSGRRL